TGSAPPPPPRPAPAAPPAQPTMRTTVRLLSHSNIVYLWPIWVLGFIFGLISLGSGQVLAIVPEGTQPRTEVEIDRERREVLILPQGKHLPKDNDGNLIRPKLHISGSKELGNFYFLITALVILFATVTFRGLWSYVIIIVIVFLTIVFNLTGVWD